MGFCIRGHASDAAFFGTAATAGPRRKGVFKGDEAPKCISVLLHASKDMLFMFGCLEAARFLVHAVRYEWLFPQWAFGHCPSESLACRETVYIYSTGHAEAWPGNH